MTDRRSRWRAYLTLSRLSNLPTVWTNVLAGLAAAGVAPRAAEFAHVLGSQTFARLAVGVSLMYVAGMFLNDLADEGFDRAHRTDRPLPRGDVRRAEVLAIGAGLMVAGMATAASRQPGSLALSCLGALAAAIVFYDLHHKGNPYGPLVMGLCRGLVYAVAAAVARGHVPAAVLVAGLVLMGYVAGLTVVAKRLGPAGGAAVPVLLAGISLVDAAVILSCGGGPGLALVAAAGFPLTLVLQRLVSGT